LTAAGQVLEALLAVLILDVAILGFVATAVLCLPLRALARIGRGPPGTEGSDSALEGFFQRAGVRHTAVTLASILVFFVNGAAWGGVATSEFLLAFSMLLGTLAFWKASDWTWRRIWG